MEIYTLALLKSPTCQIWVSPFLEIKGMWEDAADRC